MTETSTIITMPVRQDKPVPGASAGCIVPNVEIKIVSEDGKKLGFGQTGEVCARSPSNAVRFFPSAWRGDAEADDEGHRSGT